MQKSLSELAAAGLLGGALLVTDAALANEGISVDTHRLQPLSERERAYYAVHDCAGLNVCRGLGGCKVSNATLHKLARQAGVDPWTAGLAHDCAGKNECKGLGGCRVSAETFAKLKAQLPQYSEVHNCSGLNSCLGTWRLQGDQESVAQVGEGRWCFRRRKQGLCTTALGITHARASVVAKYLPNSFRN